MALGDRKESCRLDNRCVKGISAQKEGGCGKHFRRDPPGFSGKEKEKQGEILSLFQDSVNVNLQ